MSPTYKIGETRESKRGVQWTIVREMPHVNGDPAYVRACSLGGQSKTFHCAEWAALTAVCGPSENTS